jgi:hypothetical protein
VKSLAIVLAYPIAAVACAATWPPSGTFVCASLATRVTINDRKVSASNATAIVQKPARARSARLRSPMAVGAATR